MLDDAVGQAPPVDKRGLVRREGAATDREERRPGIAGSERGEGLERDTEVLVAAPDAKEQDVASRCPGGPGSAGRELRAHGQVGDDGRRRDRAVEAEEIAPRAFRD